MAEIDKVERYAWEPLGQCWPRRQVALRLLNVDKSYQRQVVSVTKARAIARAFDFAACGYIVVVERSDGSLWVIDGQHRVEAARLRGDIEKLHAIVCKLPTVADEAALFRVLNTTRVNVMSSDLYRANVTAGDPDHVACDAMVRELGYTVGRDTSRDASAIRFPRCLVKTFRASPSVCRRAIEIQRVMIGNDASLSEHIHVGLFHIIMRHGPQVVSQRAGNVFANGGKPAVENAIKRFRLTAGFAATNATESCIMGVLAALNHKYRSKLTMG